jgi:hypothetical protein
MVRCNIKYNVCNIDNMIYEIFFQLMMEHEHINFAKESSAP